MDSDLTYTNLLMFTWVCYVLYQIGKFIYGVYLKWQDMKIKLLSYENNKLQDYSNSQDVQYNIPSYAAPFTQNPPDLFCADGQTRMGPDLFPTIIPTCTPNSNKRNQPHGTRKILSGAYSKNELEAELEAEMKSRHQDFWQRPDEINFRLDGTDSRIRNNFNPDHFESDISGVYNPKQNVQMDQMNQMSQIMQLVQQMSQEMTTMKHNMSNKKSVDKMIKKLVNLKNDKNAKKEIEESYSELSE